MKKYIVVCNNGDIFVCDMLLYRSDDKDKYYELYRESSKLPQFCNIKHIKNVYVLTEMEDKRGNW